MIISQSRGAAWQLGRILIAVCLLNAVLIAIPGFFSHDELDWLHRIRTSDAGWTLGLGSIDQSPFYRPLGSLAISLVLRMAPQPLVSHVALVVLQAVNSGLLYLLVRCFRPDRALGAAILFAVMPGTAFAAGWVGACFDLQFTGLALLSLWMSVRFWRGGPGWCGLLSASACAAGLLCKESALMIPAAAAVLALCDHARADKRRVATLATAFAATVLVYLVLRLPVLLHMGTVARTGGYGFGHPIDVARHALAYFGFPFAASLPEITGILDLGAATIIGGVLLHLGLVAVLWRREGIPAAALYILAFFLPLLPVLVISKHETQYVYAACIAPSVALALTWRPRPVAALATAMLAGVLVLHAGVIQLAMYQTGRCQARVLATTAVALPLLPPVNAVAVYAPDDTPWWIAARSFFQNPLPVGAREVTLTTTQQPGAALLRLSRDCSVSVLDSRRGM